MPSELCLLRPSFPSLSEEGRVDEEVQGCFCLAQKKNFLSCIFLLLNRKTRELTSPSCSQPQDCLCGHSLYTLMPAAPCLQPGTLHLHGMLAGPSVLRVTWDCSSTRTKIPLCSLRPHNSTSALSCVWTGAALVCPHLTTPEQPLWLYVWWLL